MSQPSGLPRQPSLCIQHGLESKALSANTQSRHKSWGSYALRLAHQPILSCVIRPVLTSLWTHSCGIKVNPTPNSPPVTALLPSPPSLGFFVFPFPRSPATSDCTLTEPRGCAPLQTDTEANYWLGCFDQISASQSTHSRTFIHELERAGTAGVLTSDDMAGREEQKGLSAERRTNFEARYRETRSSTQSWGYNKRKSWPKRFAFL